MKLSDALRGAADSAPLDGTAIDLPRATRRAAQRRGLRAGANGLVGAGAVALVAVAVVQPGAGSGAVDEFAMLADGGAAAEQELGGDMAAGAPEAASSLAWGVCGTRLPDLSGVVSPWTMTGELAADAETDGGSLPAVATLTSETDAVGESFGVDAVVLWDGMVVGSLATTLAEPAELEQLTLSAGGELVRDVTMPLVNCWDGAPLPAGEYQLVLSEELFGTGTVEDPPLPPAEEPPADGPVEEPVLEPEVEPELEPGLEEAPGDGAATSGMAGDAAVGGPAEDPAVGEPFPVIASAGARVVAPPLDFTITGEPVEDPFAEYLRTDGPGPGPVEPGPVEPGPVEPGPSLPAGALDAATVRDLMAAGQAGAWDMAAGTQRWLRTYDSLEPSAGVWWGCAAGDEGVFPSRSAEVDLLDVDVDAPASIDLSYGWVVDGNPEVRVTLTNTSTHDISSFWGATSLQLALVRDGRIVAESHPVSPQQYGDAVALDEASADAAIGPDGVPALAGGASLSHLFLWRDVSGCWDATGPATVDPGTYTLLAAHPLSAGGPVAMPGDADEPGVTDVPAPLFDEPAADPFGTGDGADELSVAPAPGQYDSIEVQVWTSLGDVTVN